MGEKERTMRTIVRMMPTMPTPPVDYQVSCHHGSFKQERNSNKTNTNKNNDIQQWVYTNDTSLIGIIPSTIKNIISLEEEGCYNVLYTVQYHERRDSTSIDIV